MDTFFIHDLRICSFNSRPSNCQIQTEWGFPAETNPSLTLCRSSVGSYLQPSGPAGFSYAQDECISMVGLMYNQENVSLHSGIVIQMGARQWNWFASGRLGEARLILSGPDSTPQAGSFSNMVSRIAQSSITEYTSVTLPGSSYAQQWQQKALTRGTPQAASRKDRTGSTGLRCLKTTVLLYT